MYNRFGLTLMVTQECNLACDYCYISQKPGCVMPVEVGKKAIDRAVVSIETGGKLELGYFGGEPFFVSDLMADLSSYAKKRTSDTAIGLDIRITTNGTILDEKALGIMMMPEVNVVFSIDGRKKTHDQHRHFKNGRGSFDIVSENFQKLLGYGKKAGVVAVVSPANAGQLDQEVLALYKIGCRQIELSLDLWARWDSKAMQALHDTIGRCAEIWAAGLPEYRLNWFDDKAVGLADIDKPQFRCGFGKGDIAVSPDGYLYPCERLIADDSADNPMRLKGHVYDGKDFLFGDRCEIHRAGECMNCGIKEQCNTDCLCCNYARTGKADRPDKLLCLFNQWCLQETESALNKIIAS